MAVDTSNATAAAATQSLRARVTGAIKQAASATGASFEYLLATAKMESDFNPTANAATSSARGLYQFIEQTWLATVKEEGGQLGYGQFADAITRTTAGDYAVVDPTMRRAIMKLRDDPAASSKMAALLTQSNSFQLTGRIGRRPNDAELYMAHFLGLGGAAKLIASAEETPQASAVRMFPAAAAANRAIFFDRAGQARSVSEVYNVLETRYAGAANSPATKTALALYGDIPSGLATGAAALVGAAAPSLDTAAYLSTFPDVRNNAAATTAAAADAQSAGDPIFRSLFQVDEGAQPVSPVVRELWGNSASLTSALRATASAPRPLDLFSDRDGTFSG